MLKYAIVLLGIAITLANLASRFVPEEVRRISRVLTWVLTAYVGVAVTLGLITLVSNWWK